MITVSSNATLDTIAASDATASVFQVKSENTTEEVSWKFYKDDPLRFLPSEIRENIETDFYETGKTSVMQRYVENNVLNNIEVTQKLFNDIYHYSVRNDRHILAWNILVVLSQLPYEYLGSWADMLAVSATRNKYLDVQEMGIRCFENWENDSSYYFLKELTFSESWLQEYADEVCAEGINRKKNVLSEENYSWKMARRTFNATSNFEEYSGGHSTSRVQDRS